MKLVRRVSVFFLAALAIVLVIYSGVFYGLVRAQMVEQFEHELYMVFNSLVAAVEVEAEDVSWQPLEHTIALASDDVQWVVIGDKAHVVDTSRLVRPDLMALAKRLAAEAPRESHGGQTVTIGDWRVLVQRLAASDPDAKPSDVDEFDEIVIVAALRSASLDANLNQLLLLVCVLPIGAWLIAAAAGHWFCRRALYPVVEMSEQARSMVDSDIRARLPLLNTNDELEELARAFNTLLDHQQRAYEQQRRFTGDAAHELRTPLTVLLGQIDVALRRTRSPEEYAETLRVLREETSQLQTIVESLLFLARSEGDATLPDTKRISLADWLPEFLGHWDEHPRRDDIHLEITADRSGVVRASPVLLMRLFDNLVENALKYSSPGTRVDIECRDDGREILVDVQDKGRGIAPEDVSEVFRPFFRTRDAREAGIVGTGLGLAIAARIAAACGGSLNCMSEPGKGSLFTVRLPKAMSIANAVASEV